MSDSWSDLVRPFADVQPASDLLPGILEREARLPTRGGRLRLRLPRAAGWVVAGAGVAAVLAGLALAAHTRQQPPIGAPSASAAKLAALRHAYAGGLSYHRYDTIADAERAVGFTLVRPQATAASDRSLDSIWVSQPNHLATLIWKSGVVEMIQRWQTCHCTPVEQLTRLGKPFRYLTVNGWPAATAPSNPRASILPKVAPNPSTDRYGTPASVEVVQGSLQIALLEFGPGVQHGLLATARTLAPATACRTASCLVTQIDLAGSIGGVYAGESKQAVEAMIGSGVVMISSATSQQQIPSPFLRVYYPVADLTVIYAQRPGHGSQVFEVITTNPRYTTATGLGVGSTLDQARHTPGITCTPGPNGESDCQGGRGYQKPVTSFTVKDGHVVRVFMAAVAD